MQVYDSFVQRTLDVEVHVKMLRTDPVLLGTRRDVSVPRPLVPGRFAKGLDALALTKHFETLVIGRYARDSTVEMADFAVGAEDFSIEEIAYTTLDRASACHHQQMQQLRELTVMITPAIMTSRLKLCCVVRAAFSRVLRSFHCILPSSLAIVTCLLLEDV